MIELATIIICCLILAAPESKAEWAEAYAEAKRFLGGNYEN